jgi:hypothetical protein
MEKVVLKIGSEALERNEETTDMATVEAASPEKK